MGIFDFKKLNKLSPSRGVILISDPFLEDYYFHRSVVLVCEHSLEDGTFGFVLNNYLDVSLSELIGEFDSFPTRISMGGPVSRDNLYFIHTLGSKIPGSIQIVRNIYMGGSYDAMMDMLKREEIFPHEIRFFVGYSGWHAGQLDKEISENSWLVADAVEEEIMDMQDDHLWKTVLNRLGGKHSIIANFPDDPSLN